MLKTLEIDRDEGSQQSRSMLRMLEGQAEALQKTPDIWNHKFIGMAYWEKIEKGKT